MLIDKIYKLLQQFSNKDEVGGYIAPDEFNQAIEFVQLEWIYENYNPETKLGFENNTRSSDTFSKLKKTLPVVVSNGVVTKPDDYLFYSSSRVSYTFQGGIRYYPVELIRDSELGERMASEINKIQKLFPVLTNQDDTLNVYPEDIQLLQLSYIRKPIIPWWNYTIVSGEPVFASTGGVTTNPNAGVTAGDSTDPELNEAESVYLVLKLLKYFSIEVKESEVYQMVNAEIKTED